MSVQEEENYVKACRYSSQMYGLASRMISDICEGLKNIDELGIEPTRKEVRTRKPQCPRILIQHMDMATRLINIMKREKPLPGTDKALIKFLPPVIQSGGIYQLNVNCTSDDHWFKDDVIIVCCGVEYEEHSMFYIRTWTITPSRNRYLEENYKFLLQIQEFIIEILRDGVELSQVYRSTCDFVRKNRPELIQHLTRSFGTVAKKQNGGYCSISADSIGIAQENMLINITVGFEELFDDTLIERRPNMYALWVGDTVKVERGKKAKYLCGISKTPDRAICIKSPRFL